jgi:hypothetical protein
MRREVKKKITADVPLRPAAAFISHHLVAWLEH